MEKILVNPPSFSDLNLYRCNSTEGFNMPSMPISHFALGMAEEVGEICGVLKKLKRGFNEREKLKLEKKLKKRLDALSQMDVDSSGKLPNELEAEYESIEIALADYPLLEDYWHREMKKKLGLEMADLYTYLDLLASKTGVDLKVSIREKFNIVNKEMDFEDRFTFTDKIII